MYDQINHWFDWYSCKIFRSLVFIDGTKTKRSKSKLNPNKQMHKMKINKENVDVC